VALRIAFSFLGLAALIIGAMIFALGPNTTGQVFAAMLRVVIPSAPPLSGLGGANIDSEMRFYAALWMAYGGTALWVARALEMRIHLLRLMLFVFFLGGVGRGISYLIAGAPHLLFVALMWIEIGLPPLLIALSYRGAKAALD